VNSTHFVWHAAFGLLATSAFVLPAHAQPSVRLDYRAPEGCPSQADFVAKVEARNSHFEAAQAASRLRGMDVSIRQGAHGFEGSLRLEAREGTSALREVHAEACSEVANGLAIVAAIALSGTQETADPTAVQASPPDPVPVPASPKRAPDAVPNAAPESAPRPRLVANSFKRDPLLEIGPGTLRFDAVRSYSLGAGVDFGLLPGLLLPRYELALAVANFVTPPDKASYLVGPILQARAAWLGPGTTHNQGFATRAFGMEVGISSCSGLPYDTQGLSLLLCGEFAVGWLKMATKDAQGQTVQTKQPGFGTAGLLLETQYKIGSVFQVGMRLGGRVQFGGMSAERADGTEIFGAPLFGAYGTAGLGLQF
jgi:hypothetical protein